MAVAEEQDVYLVAGSSNIAAFLSHYYQLPTGDNVRWFTKPTPTLTTPNRPILSKLPNNRILTPRRPHATNTQRTLLESTPGTSTTFRYQGAVISAVAKDSWFAVRIIPRIGPVAHASPAAPVVFTKANHGLVLNTTLILSSTGTLPAGLGVPGQTLFAKPIDVDTFEVSFTAGGPSIATTNAGSGTITITPTGTTAHTYIRKVVTVDAGNADITFDPALPTGASATTDSMVTFLHESHTVSSLGTINGVPRKSIVKTNGVGIAAFDNTVGNNVTDKWVIMFNGSSPDTPPFPNGNEARRIKVRMGDNEVELYEPYGHDYLNPTNTPQAGDGFVVLMGPDAVHAIEEITSTRCVLQDIQFAFGEEPCLYTGVDYNNWDQTPFLVPRAVNQDPTCNCITELAWQFGSFSNKPAVFIEMGISASMISPFPFADQSDLHYPSWLWNLRSLDFDPQSQNSLYTALIKYIDVTRELLKAEGKIMRLRGIFLNISDNDPGDLQRTHRLDENIVLFRDAIRTHVGDHKIPFIMSGPNAYGFQLRPFIYAQLRQIAKQDPWSGLIDTRSPKYVLSEDGLHYSVLGQLQLAQDYFTCWRATKARGERLAA